MRKIKIIILLFLLLIIPCNVKALSPKQTLTCDNTNLLADNVVTCEYYVSVGSDKINGITTKYSYDSNLISVLFSPASSWQGDANGNRMDYYNYEDFTGKVHISTIKIKLKDGVKVDFDTTVLLKLNLLELSDENSKANIFNLEDSYSFIIKKTSVPPKTTTSTTIAKPSTTSSVKKTTTNKTTSKNNNVTSKTEVSTTTNNVTSSEIITTKNNDNPKITSVVKTAKRDEKGKITINDFCWLIVLILILIAILLIRKIIKLAKENGDTKY